MENVEGAEEHLRAPIRLCGSAFTLGFKEGDVWFELQRHRLFEVNWATSENPLTPPGCYHSGGPVAGIYGGHVRNRSKVHGGRGTRDVWTGGHKTVGKAAMRMPWATMEGLSEAIPPVYTRWIGKRLMTHLRDRQRVAA